MQYSITEHAQRQWEFRCHRHTVPLRDAVDRSEFIGERNGARLLYNRWAKAIFVVVNAAVITCYAFSPRSPRLVRDLVARHLAKS